MDAEMETEIHPELKSVLEQAVDRIQARLKHTSNTPQVRAIIAAAIEHDVNNELRNTNNRHASSVRVTVVDGKYPKFEYSFRLRALQVVSIPQLPASHQFDELVANCKRRFGDSLGVFVSTRAASIIRDNKIDIPTGVWIRSTHRKYATHSAEHAEARSRHLLWCSREYVFDNIKVTIAVGGAD